MANSSLIEFVLSLNQSEITVIEEYFGKTVKSKELKLFRTIISKRQKISDEKLVENLVIDKSALRILKSSLFDKMSEALISDRHLQNGEIFSLYSQAIFKLNKRMVLIKILIKTSNLGRDGMLKTLIKETIRHAKEYEAYSVLAEAYRYKKYYGITLSGDIKQFNGINEVIKFYDYCIEAKCFASDCYDRLIINLTSVKSF